MRASPTHQTEQGGIAKKEAPGPRSVTSTSTARWSLVTRHSCGNVTFPECRCRTSTRAPSLFTHGDERSTVGLLSELHGEENAGDRPHLISLPTSIDTPAAPRTVAGGAAFCVGLATIHALKV